MNKRISFDNCSLLEQIPQTFANTQETETILAPVIQSGIQALKVNDHLFHISFNNLRIYPRERTVRVKSMSSQQRCLLRLHRVNYRIVMIKNHLEQKKKRFVYRIQNLVAFENINFRRYLHPLIILTQNLVKNVLRMDVLLICLFFRIIILI